MQTVIAESQFLQSKQMRLSRSSDSIKDALCPHLFTLCLNPVACPVNEGYRLFKPVGTKVTHLLYVDDLEVFASSGCKLNKALRPTSTSMQDMGFQWNPKKCNVIYVRKGKQVEDATDLKLDETTLAENHKTGVKYVFPGVRESVLQDEKLTIKVLVMYLHRLSITWTTLLPDANRIKATNQFCLHVLMYPMWTQHWPLEELQSIEKDTRKLISENSRIHPFSFSTVLHLPRDK